MELLQQYRLSHGLLIPDGLIAATAIEAGIPLISKNQKDYRFIQELQLLPYPP
ncbi:PIN domain-containing protein [Thiothrix nivea]|uniref:PIN domain-containing protein n=1 Tax=Thiothrix nivea TaxID=1031 RepID=UPI001FE0B956|nr:PIN domain-containing protein [Thiothrix nivea]